MNYRHIYHAGNFADVFKHWVLTLILQKLCQKDKPFFLLDTHAGLGFYDLHHVNAQNTLEYTTGIDRFIKHKVALEFEQYVQIVNQYIQQYNIYPGSPAIMQHFLRSDDRLFLNELHKDDYLVLRENFESDRRVKILHEHAYQCLKALMPPKERRGLILIDPAFEERDEIEQLINATAEALKRFATGIYVIWYPIKDRKIIEKFYRKLSTLPLPQSVYVELHANENIGTQLSSCGLVIINPPWQLVETLQENMPLLLKYLNFSQGTYKINNL